MSNTSRCLPVFGPSSSDDDYTDDDKSSSSSSSTRNGRRRMIRVGCIGGGQLGRMMAMVAPRLNIEMICLDPAGDECPAADVLPSTTRRRSNSTCNSTCNSSSTGAAGSSSSSSSSSIIKGRLDDELSINKLANMNVDVLTMEIEHVNVNALYKLEQQNSSINIQPSAKTLHIISDKYIQKCHFQTYFSVKEKKNDEDSSSRSSRRSSSIPLPPFMLIRTISDIHIAMKKFHGPPIMLKTRRGGYDGRGNSILKSTNYSDIYDALMKLGIGNIPRTEEEYEKQQQQQQREEVLQEEFDNIYAEGWIDFQCEIAVMVVRSSLAKQQQQKKRRSRSRSRPIATTTTTSQQQHQQQADENDNNNNDVQEHQDDDDDDDNDDACCYSTRSYPAVTSIQQNSICRVVLAPARNISDDIRREAEQLAMKAIDSLDCIHNDNDNDNDNTSSSSSSKGTASGVFGVEMFVVKDSNTSSSSSSSSTPRGHDGHDGRGRHPRVLLNEIAPRPHNSGHYTQDACITCQFENHLRAICGLPLGSTTMITPHAAMVNVLGSSNSNNSNSSNSNTATDMDNMMMISTMRSSKHALRMSNTAVHWYGKRTCRMGRKMGHINILGNTEQQVDMTLRTLMNIEQIPISLVYPEDNNKEEEITMKTESTTTTVANAQSTTTTTTTQCLPVVGIVMGSQSDLPTMNDAAIVLEKFHVGYEMDIVSAHRTPDKLYHYATTAHERGIQVIIAGAGGAAHLPGMIASMTTLPVIGVPIVTSTLQGVDSLYSIVQMPRGVPVATVAIGNATNAALLAIRILLSTSASITTTSRAKAAGGGGGGISSSISSSSSSQQQQQVEAVVDDVVVVDEAKRLHTAMENYQLDMKNMVDDMSTKLSNLGSDSFVQEIMMKEKSTTTTKSLTK